MRELIFFVNKKITAKDCFEALKNEIKHVEMNGSENIWINAKSKSFLIFTDDTLDDFIFNSPKELEEFKSKIPLKNPVLIDFQTHRSIDAKRVIKVLMQICPELFVNVNDESNIFCTAQEYLDTKFDY